MSDTRVLVLVGSLRADSLNRKIAETLQALGARGRDRRDRRGPGRAAVLQRGPRRRQTSRPPPRRCAPRSPAPTACWPSRRSTTAPCRRPQQRHRLAVAPLRRRRHQGQAVRRRRRHPHAVRRQVGPPDTARSAGIAGAVVVEDVTVSQSALEVDVLTDPEVLGRLRAAVPTLVELRRRGHAAWPRPATVRAWPNSTT